MENKDYVIKRDEMEVVNGKVVISSEELVEAVQSYEMNLNEEDAANVDIVIFKGHGC